MRLPWLLSLFRSLSCGVIRIPALWRKNVVLVAASLWAQDSKTAVDDSQKNALELAQQGQALVRVGEPKKAIELLSAVGVPDPERRLRSAQSVRLFGDPA